MVDFNNEKTIGVPASDIVRVLILEKRENVMLSLEDYQRKKASNIHTDTRTLKARTYTLYLELSSMIKRSYSKMDFDYFEDKFKSDDYKDILEIIYRINDILDSITLTRVDTRRKYDTTRCEVDNVEHGL